MARQNLNQAAHTSTRSPRSSTGASPSSPSKENASGGPTHDLASFVRDVGARLASRSRHVCLVIGAGAGRACHLPDVKELIAVVLEKLPDGLKAAFETQLEGRTLEEALSRVRTLALLLSGDQTLDDLTADKAHRLDYLVCDAIVEALDLENADLAPAEALAAWIQRADYSRPVEVFSLNYDLILESAFERRRTPYFDGFVGGLAAPFYEELVDAIPPAPGALPAEFARLWKLHGSVNWRRTKSDGIVRFVARQSDDLPVAIYPSDMKYDESRRAPFLVLHDRFRKALGEAETMTLVIGYSFGDQHINELLFQAAERRQRSEILVFNYGLIPDVLASRAALTPNIQVVAQSEGIIGGVRGTWVAPTTQSDLYWDKGICTLPDFRHLALYLARSSFPVDVDRDLDSLLERLMPPVSAADVPAPEAAGATHSVARSTK